MGGGLPGSGGTGTGSGSGSLQLPAGEQAEQHKHRRKLLNALQTDPHLPHQHAMSSPGILLSHVHSVLGRGLSQYGDANALEPALQLQLDRDVLLDEGPEALLGQGGYQVQVQHRFPYVLNRSFSCVHVHM